MTLNGDTVKVTEMLTLRGLAMGYDRGHLTSAACDVTGSDEPEEVGFEKNTAMIEPISKDGSFCLLPGEGQVMGLMDLY